MAKFKSLTQLMAVIADAGHSKYKTARALMFVHRHRKAHHGLILDLARAQQSRERSLVTARHNRRVSWNRAKPSAGQFVPTVERLHRSRKAVLNQKPKYAGWFRKATGR